VAFGRFLVAVGEQVPYFDVRCYGATDGAGLAARIWPCYDEVFGDFGDLETWRADMFARHAARSGYRLVVAADGAAVAGFSWGYIGERGQYWADLVAGELPGVAGEWVGGHFEFVTLGVAPKYRRHGLGRRLHDALLDGVGRKALLSTADDPADPAVRLYLSSGWRKLGVLKPDRQVMGRTDTAAGC
jgi:ribosomal protein S18 acetylase RimI-like enzyme